MILAELEAATIASFAPRDLSSTAWALARSNLCDAPLLTSISAAALPLLAARQPLAWSAQDLANTAWSCAQLKWTDIPLLDAIAQQAILPLCKRSSKF